MGLKPNLPKFDFVWTWPETHNLPSLGLDLCVPCRFSSPNRPKIVCLEPSFPVIEQKLTTARFQDFLANGEIMFFGHLEKLKSIEEKTRRFALVVFAPMLGFRRCQGTQKATEKTFKNACGSLPSCFLNTKKSHFSTRKGPFRS